MADAYVFRVDGEPIAVGWGETEDAARQDAIASTSRAPATADDVRSQLERLHNATPHRIAWTGDFGMRVIRAMLASREEDEQ